jgi:TRAP-type C4-dicarboxylate transport system permease large subunit
MMDGTVNPASIATSISIGALFLAGFFPLLVGLYQVAWGVTHRGNGS